MMILNHGDNQLISKFIVYLKGINDIKNQFLATGHVILSGRVISANFTKYRVFFIFPLFEVPYLPLKLSDSNKLAGF